MKTKTISVSYGRKINLGDYNSLSLDVSIWSDVEEGEDPGSAIESLQEQAREAVKREARRLIPQVKPGQSVEGAAQLANEDPSPWIG